MRLAPAIVSCVFLLVATAAAEPRSGWLIVPSSVGTAPTWTPRSSTRLRRQLKALGVEVWSTEDVARELERVRGRPHNKLTSDDLVTWGVSTAEGQRTLALGEYPKSLEALRKAHAIAERSPETLLHVRDRARRAFDNCLHIVRALVETEQQVEAREQATACRRLLPFEEATTRLHPPWVLEVLQETDSARSVQVGGLRIRSEPEGCLARINGVAVGGTPLELPHLFPGTYYVQVACDFERHGRVYAVDVASAQHEVVVDTRLDHALRTRPQLEFRYGSRQERAKHERADIAQAAEALRAAQVVRVWADTPTSVRLELVNPAVPKTPPSAAARVRSSKGETSDGDLQRAARALTERRCVDLTGDAPTAMRCSPAPAIHR